jgi:hypothetical protein
MKIVKLAAVLAISFVTLTVVAQEKKEAKTEAKKEEPAKAATGNGNAEAMRRNLNYPNATNPANNNNQKYDKGTGRVESTHPDDNMGSHYTNKNYQEKKK